MTAGKPAAESPRLVAISLGFSLVGHSNSPSWGDLADMAAEAYWKARPTPSPIAFAEYRRRRLREQTPADVWLRRGAAS